MIGYVRVDGKSYPVISTNHGGSCLRIPVDSGASGSSMGNPSIGICNSYQYCTLDNK